MKVATLKDIPTEEIVKAIKNTELKSIRAILKSFGINNIRSGSHYYKIRNIAKQLNLNTEHWVGGHFSKGKLVEKRGRKRPIEDYLSGKVKVTNSFLKERLFEDGHKQKHCEQCGISEWQGKPAPLQLHHVNGNNEDMTLENLQILCANCHCQTDNFCRRKDAIY